MSGTCPQHLVYNTLSQTDTCRFECGVSATCPRLECNSPISVARKISENSWRSIQIAISIQRVHYQVIIKILKAGYLFDYLLQKIIEAGNPNPWELPVPVLMWWRTAIMPAKLLKDILNECLSMAKATSPTEVEKGNNNILISDDMI